MPKSGYKTVKWLFGKEIEIPKEWEYFSISEFVEKDTGDWGIDFEEPIPEGYTPAKIIRNTDFKNWDIDLGKDSPKRLIKKNKINQIRLNELDILIEASGGGPDQPLGRSIHLNKNDIENSTIPFTFSNFLIRFKIKNMNSKFFYYFLKRWYQTKLMKNFETQTTNLRNLDVKFFLKTFQICSPKLQEQQKIVSILSNMDELISSYDKTIESTKKLKKGLMQTLLTRGIGHKKFKKVKWLFGKEIEIPEEWEIKNLGDSSKITILAGFEWTKYITLQNEGEVGVIRAQNVAKGKFIDSNIMYISNQVSDGLPRSKLFGNEVLIVWIGEVGNVCLSPEKGSWHLGKNVAKITPLHELNKKFLCYFLQTNLGLKNVIANSKISVQPSINMATIRKFKILLPDIKEQHAILTIIEKFDENISKLESKKKSAESLKKGLMQKLLTGQIRVTV